MFVFLSEHAILRKAKPRLFDWQFIQTGNYGEHRKFAYRETVLKHLRNLNKKQTTQWNKLNEKKTYHPGEKILPCLYFADYM